MPRRLQTEPPEPIDVDQSYRIHAFFACVVIIVGLAVVALMLSYRFR